VCANAGARLVQRPSSFSESGSISVLKFGGSSFANPEAYHVVARHLAGRVARGERPCVVVSAMSGTTGRLSELLHELVPAPQPEDVDAVLATGEILAASLVQAVLTAHGVTAVSLNAFQLGWRASDRFTAGELLQLSGDAIAAAQRRASVVVISGGQATTADGRLVMLGRNSSDLTAIAVAVAMEQPAVTICSDVEGVFTADPYRFSNTRLIPKLGFRAARAYSRWGAKVLHSGCTALAEQHRVRIQCASLDRGGQLHVGTEIAEDGDGVQVCLPDHVAIIRPGDGVADLAAACREHAPRTELVVVDNLVGHFATRRDEDLQRLTTAGLAVTVEALAPVFAFSQDGALRAYATAEAERQTLAQEIHDRLVAGTSFLPSARPLEKQRGTHSDVYGRLSRDAST
jgi:aspartate kinase